MCRFDDALMERFTLSKLKSLTKFKRKIWAIFFASAKPKPKKAGLYVAIFFARAFPGAKKGFPLPSLLQISLKTNLL